MCLTTVGRGLILSRLIRAVWTGCDEPHTTPPPQPSTCDLWPALTLPVTSDLPPHCPHGCGCPLFSLRQPTDMAKSPGAPAPGILQPFLVTTPWLTRPFPLLRSLRGLRLFEKNLLRPLHLRKSPLRPLAWCRRGVGQALLPVRESFRNVAVRCCRTPGGTS